MSGVNPQGCQVFSFKQPSSEELDHDFLWRYAKCLPERGRFGIFNRSYYEEVLVVRVHDEILNRQKLPPTLIGKRIWDERLSDIAHFEEYLTRQGTTVVKFFLHLSRKEQKKRFKARLDKPEKHWKFSTSDIHERQFWDDYMHAFEEAICATASKHAPWFVVRQNIGTATSSAMAAIGASSTARRLALAYILFKLIAAVIALVLFPVVTPLLIRASSTIDGVTLLAGYHTAYNVVGVAVVLPLIGKFTRFVERILPERGSPLTRCLDSSALATPIVAVEAMRRTVARALGALCFRH